MKTLTTDKILHVFSIVTTYLNANHIGHLDKNHPFTIEEIFKACINVSKEEVRFLIREMLANGILQEICINNNFYYNFPENISIYGERERGIKTLEIKLTKSKPVNVPVGKMFFAKIQCPSSFLRYSIMFSINNKKNAILYTPINYYYRNKTKINHVLKEGFPNGWMDFSGFNKNENVKIEVSENAPEDYEANIFLKIKQ